MKIMTLNLRYDKPDPGNNAWKFRRSAIAQFIQYYDPDFIGTQEGKANQLLDLHRLLPNYQSIGSDRTGDGSGEHCAIFYHLNRFNCIDSKDFWLSETPHLVGSITPEWGNKLPRMVSWGIFSSPEIQQEITIFNTHLDYLSESSRKFSVQLIQKFLGEIKPPSSHLILTGDFNAEPDSLERKLLLEPLSNQIQLLDVLNDINLEDQKTFHDFTGKATAAVDTIYYDHRLPLKSVTIDSNLIDYIWPSDHFPVIAEFFSATFQSNREQ